jgi:hypothetical protein
VQSVFDWHGPQVPEGEQIGVSPVQSLFDWHCTQTPDGLHCDVGGEQFDGPKHWTH